jgi:hypothetical protein
MKTLIIAAAVSATTICGAAAEPPADALRGGVLELADSQLDAIHAGAASSESESTAAEVGSQAIDVVRKILRKNLQTVSGNGNVSESTSSSTYSE